MSTVFLSRREVQEFEDLCNDPFLELGMTMLPKHLKCLKPKVTTHGIKVIILFEEHADAEKWNSMHETRIRRGGHLATITLSALVALVSMNYTASVATASAVGVIKDEMQARVWYPKMFKGWVLTRLFNFTYEQIPRREFYMQWTDVIQDETGKEVERKRHSQSRCSVGGALGIPEKLVIDLMNSFPLHTLRFK